MQQNTPPSNRPIMCIIFVSVHAFVPRLADRILVLSYRAGNGSRW